MQSDEGGNEPDKTPMPGDFARDPLELAESLAKEYALLSDAYEAPGGTRDQLNLHLERSYRLGFFYYQTLDEYRAFQAHEYFRDLRQRPNEHNIMRSVLKFTMQAKRNKQRLYRLYKRAPVFEYLYAEGVVPDDVAALLKERGGIDCIYDQLCAERKLRREAPQADDEGEGDGLGTPDDEQLDAHEDEHPDPDEDAEQAASEDGGKSDNAIVLSATPPRGDQGAPPPPAMPHTTNDQPDEVKRESRSIIQTEQPLRHRVDEETELIVKFHAWELDQIRASGGGEIVITVMPREEDAYWPTIGRIKRLFPRDEGPSPDDAEEPPAAP